MEIVLEILKYTLPSVVVFLTAFFVIRLYLRNEQEQAALKMKMSNRKDALPLRLQAYERLTIFLERINANNLIIRVRQPNMTTIDMQRALISNIRAEYEHNLSQQIYVSNEVWRSVNIAKDESIKIINLIAASLPKDASGTELSKRILEYYLKSEELAPTQKSIEIIKAEVRKIY